jgi:hypothetical protein
MNKVGGGTMSEQQVLPEIEQPMQWRELTSEEIIWRDLPARVRCVDCKGEGMFHRATCKDVSRYEVPAGAGEKEDAEIARLMAVAPAPRHEICQCGKPLMPREHVMEDDDWNCRNRVAQPSPDILKLLASLAQSEAERERLHLENIKLINDASVWRNRAIGAEEEIREGGRGIDLRRGFER